MIIHRPYSGMCHPKDITGCDRTLHVDEVISNSVAPTCVWCAAGRCYGMADDIRTILEANTVKDLMQSIDDQIMYGIVMDAASKQ